jgi:hypothetical protein
MHQYIARAQAVSDKSAAAGVKYCLVRRRRSVLDSNVQLVATVRKSCGGTSAAKKVTALPP